MTRFTLPQRLPAAPPTLMLEGSDTARHLLDASAAVRALLPRVETSVLAGQQHLAMVFAPDLFADTVNGFLAR